MIIHKMFIKSQSVPVKNGYIVADVSYKIPYKSGHTAYITGFALMVHGATKQYRLLVPSRKYVDAQGVTQYNDIYVASKEMIANLLKQAVTEFKKQAPTVQPQTVTEQQMQAEYEEPAPVKAPPVTAAQVADKTEPAVNPNHDLKF